MFPNAEALRSRMKNTITCQYCGKEIDLPEALRHEVQEKLQVEAEKAAEEKLSKRYSDQFELKIISLSKEREEEKERNKRLLDELEKLNEEIRTLRRKDEERSLEMKRKIAEEEEKIREDTRKRTAEEHELKDREKDKRLQDALKQIEELKVRMQQGSQQLQGEVLEEDLKAKLTMAFPQDTIEDVEKGVKGADLRQIVRSSRGNLCGVILWESKRTKSWSDEWLTKLKEDLRNEKAHVPVIVSTVLPIEISGFGFKDGVYLCEPKSALVVAEFLRKHLTEVAYQKFLVENKGGKAESVYKYFTSHEFRQQLESMAEVYREMMEQISRERLVLEKNLKVREVQIQRLLKNTVNIYGSIQGLVGSSLPQVKGLELLESGEQGVG